MEEILKTLNLEVSKDGRYIITKTISKYRNYKGELVGHEHITYDVNDEKDICMVKSFKTLAQAKRFMNKLEK